MWMDNHVGWNQQSLRLACPHTHPFFYHTVAGAVYMTGMLVGVAYLISGGSQRSLGAELGWHRAR